MVPLKSLGMVFFYSHSVVAVSLAIWRYLASKYGVTLNLGSGSFKVIENGAV